MFSAERFPEDDRRSGIDGRPHREPLAGRVIEGHARVKTVFTSKENLTNF